MISGLTLYTWNFQWKSAKVFSNWVEKKTFFFSIIIDIGINCESSRPCRSVTMPSMYPYICWLIYTSPKIDYKHRAIRMWPRYRQKIEKERRSAGVGSEWDAKPNETGSKNMKPYFHQYLCYLIQAGRSIFNVKPLLVTINTGCLQIMCVHFIVSLFNAFFAVLMKKFILQIFVISMT